MSFTSTDFLLFLALLLPFYWLLGKKTSQNLLLLAASYLFYGWLHPWFAVLLAVSTAADYLISRAALRQPQRAGWFLAGSLLLNLGFLGIFKYFNFFSANIAAGLSALGLDVRPAVLQIILPLGLSFYTLRKISYMIDLYHGVGKPADGWVEYALYVAFFPQIASGPIQRPRSLLPQIQSPRIWKMDYLKQAWPLAVMGLFKKLVVAAPVAVIVDKIFGLQQPSIGLLLVGGLGFTLLILADFSAYTDLSRAVAFLLGFETPENFRSPYLSLTPVEFWNRWHITLSEWLRDYIFFPLRRAFLRRKLQPAALAVWLVPPLLTLLASGLWHGAGWNYIAWGGFYGLLIALYQKAGLGGSWRPSSRLKIFLAWAVMFSLTVAGWILFRSPSLGWLGQVISHSPFFYARTDLIAAGVSLLMITFYASPLVFHRLLRDYFNRSAWLEGAYLAASLVVMILFINSATPDFIYFQF